MAHCPAYQGAICSLCCTLDARCDDLCKPHAQPVGAVAGAAALAAARAACWPLPGHRPGPLPAADAGDRAAAGLLFGLLYHQEALALGGQGARRLDCRVCVGLSCKAYAALLLVAGIVAWWLVLTHKSRQVAQEESNRQTRAADARDRIAPPDRRRAAADRPSELAERGQPGQEPLHQRHQPRAAHAAQQHPRLCAAAGRRRRASRRTAARPCSVIQRGGDHLLSLIEGTLDIARIEGGKLTLETAADATFADCLQEIARHVRAAGAQPRACASSSSSRASCRPWCAPTRSGCARS